MATALIQQILPEEYSALDEQEADERITIAKALLGEKLVILGHHYQRDEIIKFADYTGDSYKLSRTSSTLTDVEFVVFCGVHFMAESADILGGDHQHVILPNLTAGCSMADMVTISQVQELWETLAEITEKCIPITYMNSSAAIKSFCGENGGSVCTSSNCAKVFEWAFSEGEKIVFFPDEHLGRNTAIFNMGYTEDDIVVWDPLVDPEENDLEAVKRCKFILWKGWCSVHGRFSVEQVDRARKDFPDVRVIVHPECRREVVAVADGFGSTDYIVKQINAALPGSTWAIGTEINLVHRLAKQHPDKTIFCLDPIVCPCSTMYRIHPSYLCWALENALKGVVVNEIIVPERDKIYARKALSKMLELAG